MLTVVNCKNGELVIHAPQCEIDKLVTIIEQSGGTVTKTPESVRNAGNGKPEPIPRTDWAAAMAEDVKQSSSVTRTLREGTSQTVPTVPNGKRTQTVK